MIGLSKFTQATIDYLCFTRPSYRMRKFDLKGLLRKKSRPVYIIASSIPCRDLALYGTGNKHLGCLVKRQFFDSDLCWKFL